MRGDWSSLGPIPTACSRMERKVSTATWGLAPLTYFISRLMLVRRVTRPMRSAVASWGGGMGRPTKAATRLRVAQPALSRQVSDLEDELGGDLLRRTSHGVVLTEEGKLFREEVRGILKRADESVTKVRALARGEFGELQLGYV